jgi:hypothetical protein
VFQSTIIRNTLPIDTLRGQTASGGGIPNFSNGTVEIDRSLIAENEAARGGGIRNGGGTMQILNSTISGNKATASGGGILNAGTTRIAFSTIVFNEAHRSVPSTGDEPRLGGGIYNTDQLLSDGSISTVSIGNSIVAKNIDNHYKSDNICAECYSKWLGQSASFRGNVVGVLTSNCNMNDALLGNVLFDQVGSKNVPLEPLLAPLAANGGPTRTHALLAGSPAIDKAIGLLGATIYDCPDSDQRLFVRPRDGTGTKKCDVGGFETMSIPAPD